MPRITLPVILALASEGGRACPRPDAWTRLYALLPATRSDGYGAIPAAPLVLAAWHESTDEQKILRLREHLDWADGHRALDTVHAFLASLPEGEWHHVGD